MRSVAIIGAGVFGASAALELAKDFDVTLFESGEDILGGASSHNHLRHHRGYHYPRSPETALESMRARESFERHYGGCVSAPFPAYYAVTKTGSKTSPEAFLAFCRSVGLPYREVTPDAGLINRDKYELCVEVPEPVYDPDRLKAALRQRLAQSSVALRFGSKVVGGEFVGERKRLRVAGAGGTTTAEFDHVVSATYCRTSALSSWFGLGRRRDFYELVELLEVEIPGQEKVGLTLIDGEFSSLLPRGEAGTFTLGHVRASVLRSAVAEEMPEELAVTRDVASNRDEIMRLGIEDFPIVAKGRVKRSVWVTRVVKANIETTDARPTEVRDLGRGLFSIFAGKVITCVKTAQDLALRIKESR